MDNREDKRENTFDDDDDEEDFGDIKEKRQRRIKNNRRDKSKHGQLKQERIASRPRQKINMNNFDLEEWEEWEDY